MQQLYDLLISGVSGLEYRPAGAYSNVKDSISERDMLITRKRRHETALNRLRSLYLYDEDSMPEKDFIIEKQRILDQISEIDEKLRSIQGNGGSGPLADDEFIEKASYFIMVEKLLDDRTVDYEKYIRHIDLSVP